MINLVVIPDIHGISDWRFPVTNALKDPNAHIVFLGDYVDTHVQGNDWKIFENLKDHFRAITPFQNLNSLGHRQTPIRR